MADKINYGKLVLRSERPEDHDFVEEINRLAFNSDLEAAVLQSIRKSDDFIPELSIVSLIRDRIAGHILLIPVKIGEGQDQNLSLALVSMAVKPEFHGAGIGSALVDTAIKRARKRGYRSLTVIGQESYYSRFGFSRASRWDIYTPFQLADRFFLAMELVSGGLKGVSGVVSYPDEFDIDLSSFTG